MGQSGIFATARLYGSNSLRICPGTPSREAQAALASFAAALPLQQPPNIATDDMAQYLLARCEGTSVDVVATMGVISMS
jgi:hypothetical protein